MLRYYNGNGPRLASKEKGGTSNGKRAKPLYGAKKYSLISQPCTNSGCENKADAPDSITREFFVSKASTPAKRLCYTCYTKPKVKKLTAAEELLRSVGLA